MDISTVLQAVVSWAIQTVASLERMLVGKSVAKLGEYKVLLLVVCLVLHTVEQLVCRMVAKSAARKELH